MKKPARISIVEDIDQIRETLREGLQEHDDIQYISGFDNAEEALAKLPKGQPDIVIMDIGLPQMNGIECMLRVKRKLPDTAFLMFTVFEHSESVYDALKAGALGYILKRDGVEGIIEAIYELMAGGAPMSRTIARRVMTSFHTSKRLLKGLSAREEEVLQLLSKGLLYKEIAQQLNPQIEVGTVKQHIHRIYEKLQVNNRTEAINKYLGLATVLL